VRANARDTKAHESAKNETKEDTNWRIETENRAQRGESRSEPKDSVMHDEGCNTGSEKERMSERRFKRSETDEQGVEDADYS